jgi:hypothetical protein
VSEQRARRASAWRRRRVSCRSSKRFREKLSGRANDADTDSYSDGDFVEHEPADHEPFASASEQQKMRSRQKNLELLEKG